MKIVTDTPGELVLESRPWRFGLGMVAVYLVIVWNALKLIGNGGIIGGVAMIVFGAGFVWLMFHGFIRLEIVRFSRDAGSVSILRQGMSGRMSETIALRDVERAMVQTYDHGDSGPTHRVALVLRRGKAPTVPLMLAYTGGGGATRTTARINDWLAGRHA
ncbi:MAG: hypothetical protein GW886_07495 [Rhodobacterales bacterium]|nr:hypothetical protein [Rhodobacterales bacterium]NCT13100.1 hypothetical protein [Rhodobacterales bacterium]